MLGRVVQSVVRICWAFKSRYPRAPREKIVHPQCISVPNEMKRKRGVCGEMFVLLTLKTLAKND